MAALSSMIRMRRWLSEAALGKGGLRGAARQLENERCAAARPVARHEQGAAEFLCGERSAVQAEAVPGRAGREAVSEKAGHILRRDAHTVVDDANAHAGRRFFDAQG